MNHPAIQVPFLDLHSQNREIKDEVLRAWGQVLDRDWYILGQELEAFESEYAKFNECRFTLGVGNGLDALTISLHALGIGPGDRVVLPAHTFVATAFAVRATGAQIQFCDVDEATGLMTAKTLAESRDLKMVRAVIPVHLYGRSCEMQPIADLSVKYGFKIIEDNAQAQGARSNGKLAGSWGHINGTSFYPGKNLGAFGDAGAITTNDPDLHARAKMIRNYGTRTKYNHECFGVNSRLDEIQACVLRIKLKRLNEMNELRRKVANRYLDLLEGVAGLQLPERSRADEHVYHLFVVRTEAREDLKSHLARHGVESLIHYPVPVHRQGCFSDLNLEEGTFPVAEKWARTCLSLPMHPFLTTAQQDQVIESLRAFTASSETRARY